MNGFRPPCTLYYQNGYDYIAQLSPQFITHLLHAPLSLATYTFAGEALGVTSPDCVDVASSEAKWCQKLYLINPAALGSPLAFDKLGSLVESPNVSVSARLMRR
ncbi:hypothetical protein B0H14DRAFT_2571494 [Mycena olivaceomarginata]|nr:hypothetical protein B0H14DRAFT_2571494 [Mycena olivaceomarginata]